MTNILYGLPIVLAVTALVLCALFFIGWLADRYPEISWIVVLLPFVLIAAYHIGASLQP